MHRNWLFLLPSILRPLILYGNGTAWDSILVEMHFNHSCHSSISNDLLLKYWVKIFFSYRNYDRISYFYAVHTHPIEFSFHLFKCRNWISLFCVGSNCSEQEKAISIFKIKVERTHFCIIDEHFFLRCCVSTIILQIHFHSVKNGRKAKKGFLTTLHQSAASLKISIHSFIRSFDCSLPFLHLSNAWKASKWNRIEESMQWNEKKQFQMWINEQRMWTYVSMRSVHIFIEIFFEFSLICMCRNVCLCLKNKITRKYMHYKKMFERKYVEEKFSGENRWHKTPRMKWKNIQRNSGITKCSRRLGQVFLTYNICACVRYAGK